MDRFYNGKSQHDTSKKRFIPTPYVNGLSEKLKKMLNPYDLTISSKSTKKIGDIYSRMKYPVPKHEKSKVIYSIDCKQCDTSYVGTTKQKIKNRMTKHKSDVRLKKLKETTGLTIHSVTKNHTFDFDKIKILDQIPNYFQRMVAEKMYIHRTTNNCNTQIDKEGLHKSYINLLQAKTRIRPPNTSRMQPPNTPRIQPPT